MVNEDFSCIKEVTKIVNLTLPSMYNTNEINGICDALETWKRQYVKQLQGIVVGYKNVSLTSKRGFVKVDSPLIHCNVKATFEIFYPTIGSIIKGKVNRISQDYIGCLVHDTINVTVHRTTDISCDISNFINLDHLILFKITRIIFKSKIIHVKGKITEECVTLMKNEGMINDNIDACDDNVDDMQTTCSSPDFLNSNSVIYNNPSTSSNNATESEDFSTFNNISSHISSPKKKKKHKKSKENPSMSPSLSGSLENDTDTVESTQSSTDLKKRKRKKSDACFTSPISALEDDTESMHPIKKIKTEDFNSKNINQVELTQSLEKSRKRKRKKSDQNLESSSDALGNEMEPIHLKKKMKTEEQMTNDRMEFFDRNSSDMINNVSYSENSSLSAPSPVVHSLNVAAGIENPVVKVELLSPIKKKKHKKSKSSLEKIAFPENMLRTEIGKTEPASNPYQSFNEASSSSNIKSEDYVLTSPDIFDEHSSEVGNEPKLVKPKKEKIKKSDKKGTSKKKKDKAKKGSIKDKKKKLKVLSSKKNLHKAKLKKKKSKDSKNKKSKKTKTKHVPE